MVLSHALASRTTFSLPSFAPARGARGSVDLLVPAEVPSVLIIVDAV